MKVKLVTQKLAGCLVALTCTALILPGNTVAGARVTPQDQSQQAVKIPSDQLDALVAPIALYPDSLLSQTLVASTYPLEIIQLQQWLERNKDLAKDQKKLADAVKKQSWDPSIQAMAILPDLVKRLADDVQWTTDLGNAFLAQQSDVMDAIQRMRAKAQGKGTLQSNQQQTVETQVVESKQVIVIEQANPQVVYVPSYDPTYVYGAPIYPYPPIYYPPYPTGGVIAASAISFGVGLAIGAAWGGGGWGWGAGWGGNDININNNNNFNRNTNINGGNRVNNIGSGNKWQHNPTHRGGAPYGDRATANRFGGAARGDSLANRQRTAQRDIGRQGGNLGSANRGGVGDRGGIGDRGGAGNRGGVGDRGGLGDRGGAGNRDLGNRGGVGDRGSAGSRDLGNRGSSGISDRSRGGSSGSFGGGGDRVGNRSLGSSSGAGSRSGGFGGGSGGFGGSSTRASSSRGSSSMGGGRGGGGGGRGGRGGGRRR